MTILLKIISGDYKKMEKLLFFLLRRNFIFYSVNCKNNIIIYKYKTKICKEYISSSLINVKIRHVEKTIFYIKYVFKINYVVVKCA